MTSPVLARVRRSGFVESEHRGIVVGVDAAGRRRLAVGDVDSPIFPRSTNKPLQSVAMLRAGLPLDGHLLALATASHSGEAYHLAGVRQILADAGLTVDALRNAPALPDRPDDAHAWRCAGHGPEALAHGCSGKHAAMLATCALNGWPLESYLDPHHPLQVGVAEAVAELAGEPPAATGVDGCGAPVLAISPAGLARAYARIATAAPDTPAGRVATAMRTYPQWVGGTDRGITAVHRAVPGLIAKDAAEAVAAAALPDGRAVAVKIADGGERAVLPVLVAALRALGLDDAETDGSALATLSTAPVLGRGEPVGLLEIDLDAAPAPVSPGPRRRGSDRAR